MSDTRNRLTSEVRSHQVRAEAAQPLRPGDNAGPTSEKRKRTSRFRMQRVSLLPFVPAPLIAYVDRARRRRRLRWFGLVALAGLGVGAWPVARWVISSSDAPVVVSPSLPKSVSPRGELPEQPLLRSARPTENTGPLASSASPALPPASAVVGPRRSRPVSTVARPPSNEASPQSPHRQPAAPASAWWW